LITNFSSSNSAFSDKAHSTARTQIYPLIFNTSSDNISYENTTITENNSERNRILDGEMAVDRFVKVKVKDYNAPLTYTVQERFIRPNYIDFQDVTITEFNYSSNLPSELHKLSGGLFLYGYYDELTENIIQFVVFSSSALLLKIATGEITFTKRRRNPRTNQTFLKFSFESLRQNGLLLYEKDFRVLKTCMEREIIV
jgi:hypothetical protein